MNEQQLREQLDQLADAIDGINAPTEDKAKIHGIVDGLESQLSSPVVDGEPHTLAEQVEDAISSFEADHPTVAGILNNIMVTLTSMGV